MKDNKLSKTKSPTVDQYSKLATIQSNPDNLNQSKSTKKKKFFISLFLILIIIVIAVGYYLFNKPITLQNIKKANLQSVTIANDLKKLNSSSVYNVNLSSLTNKVLTSPQVDVSKQISTSLSQVNEDLNNTQQAINEFKSSPVLRNENVKRAFQQLLTSWQVFDRFVQQLNQSYKTIEPSLLSYFLTQASLLVKIPNISNNPVQSISYLNQVKSANLSALSTFQTVKVSNQNLKSMVQDSIQFINQSDGIITQADQDQASHNFPGLISQTKLFLNLEVGYFAQIKLASQKLTAQYNSLYPAKALKNFQQQLKKLKAS